MKRTYITTEGKRFEVTISREIVTNKKDGKKYIKTPKWYVRLSTAKILDYILIFSILLAFLLLIGLVGGIETGYTAPLCMWFTPIGFGIVGLVAYNIEKWLDILEF